MPHKGETRQRDSASTTPPAAHADRRTSRSGETRPASTSRSPSRRTSRGGEQSPERLQSRRTSRAGEPQSSSPSRRTSRAGEAPPVQTASRRTSRNGEGGITEAPARQSLPAIRTSHDGSPPIQEKTVQPSTSKPAMHSENSLTYSLPRILVSILPSFTPIFC